ARAIEKKVRKMEFGTRFGMPPEFSGVVSHSREALARTMEWQSQPFKIQQEKHTREKISINKFSSSLVDQEYSVFRDISGKYVRSGCTTALNVVPWETDGESVLREACLTRASFHDLLLFSYLSFIVSVFCFYPIRVSFENLVNVIGAPITNTVANHAENPEKFNWQNFKRKVKPPNAQAVQDVEAWKHSDFLCRDYVLNGLVGSLYNVYCKTTTAKELWVSLERKHKTEDAGTNKFYRNLVEFRCRNRSCETDLLRSS
ncbi:hypothetical protein Tco_0789288, partial [Tanacetum coccineum]